MLSDNPFSKLKLLLFHCLVHDQLYKINYITFPLQVCKWMISQDICRMNRNHNFVRYYNCGEKGGGGFRNKIIKIGQTQRGVINFYKFQFEKNEVRLVACIEFYKGVSTFPFLYDYNSTSYFQDLEHGVSELRDAPAARIDQVK